MKYIIVIEDTEGDSVEVSVRGIQSKQEIEDEQESGEEGITPSRILAHSVMQYIHQILDPQYDHTIEHGHLH